MKCFKCGSFVNNGEIFCSNCGERLDKLKTIEFKNSNLDNENDAFYEDPLIDLYIGSNKEKLKSDSFSKCAFLFGWIYLFYRKMWAHALIIFIITFLLIYFKINIFVIILILLSIHLVWGIIFKKKYIENVRQKVNNFRLKNSIKEENDIVKSFIKYMKKTTFIMFLLTVVCIFTMAFNIYNNREYIIKTFNKDYQISGEKEKDNKDNVSYNNLSFGNLNVKIPTELKYSKETDGLGKIYLSSDDNCGITIKDYDKSSTNNELKKLVFVAIDYSNGIDNVEVATIKSELINSNIWYTEEKITAGVKRSYYAISKDNRTYLVGFLNSGSKSDCDKLLNGAKKTMKIK